MGRKREDLQGKRFGKLKVIERTSRDERGYFVWECLCDCGNKTLVNTKRLKRGTIQDCGCVDRPSERRGRKAEDIRGKRFGKLKPIRRVESLNGRTRWECKCQCGNVTITTTHDLKSGHVKSCGCLKTEKGIFLRADLTNQQFGRLTVLYPTEKRDYKGSIIWKCKCECGNECEVSNGQLVQGNTISCGCKRKENGQNLRESLNFDDGTCYEYLKYRTHRSDNKTGVTGVTKHRNKYRAWIGFKSKNYYLGTYRTLEEAKEVRSHAEEKIHRQYINLFEKWRAHTREDPVRQKEYPLTFEVKVKEGELTVEIPEWISSIEDSMEEE